MGFFKAKQTQPPASQGAAAAVVAVNSYDRDFIKALFCDVITEIGGLRKQLEITQKKLDTYAENVRPKPAVGTKKKYHKNNPCGNKKKLMFGLIQGLAGSIANYGDSIFFSLDDIAEEAKARGILRQIVEVSKCPRVSLGKHLSYYRHMEFIDSNGRLCEINHRKMERGSFYEVSIKHPKE